MNESGIHMDTGEPNESRPRVYTTPLGDAFLRFILPFALMAAYLLLLYLILDFEDFKVMSGLMTAYLIPPAGKESIIPLGVSIGLPWWLVASSMAFMDTVTALFMVWNFDLALKIPLLGGWIGNFMAGGQKFFWERPWLKRLSVFGLMLFVMFPLQGTGGIGGSIVGRMLGLRWYEVLGAIAAGAFIGCFLIALGAEVILSLFQADAFYGIIALLVVAIVGVISYLYHRRRKKRRRDHIRT